MIVELVLDLGLCTQQLADAEYVEDLISVFCEMMASGGCEVTSFFLLTGHTDQPSKLNETIRSRLHSKSINSLSIENSSQVDKVADLAQSCLGAFRYSVAGKNFVVDSLSDDICVPLRGRYSSFAIVLVKSKIIHEDKKLTSLSLSCVDAIASEFYKRYCVIGQDDPNTRRLTSKELQVLRLVANGDTKRQIAELLQVTNHAVDFHYRNIMRKYETTRIVVAVVKALKEGMI